MDDPGVAPILSTPDTHIFEDPTPSVDIQSLPKLSDEQLNSQYEIQRTVGEIRDGKWKRIALQFPDQMLVDAPRVFEALSHGLENARKRRKISSLMHVDKGDISSEDIPEKIYILADTSYGACCVDEIAAEHVDADVVVHYGRACLSPTARLPVIYVFTSCPLDLKATKETFMQTYPERDKKVILMADIPYSHHVSQIYDVLKHEGYNQVFATTIMHDPSSLLPNRTVPEEVGHDEEKLRSYSLFHISDPPTALLLTLSSRFESIHIFPTTNSSSFSPSSISVPSDKTGPQPLAPASTTPLLRRRYAMLRTLSAISIIGILINTLSVRSYLPALQRIQRLITEAGKKYYTVVVGKVNAAKVANFAEIGAWVVVGCWESGLVDMKAGEGYWRPMVTPFELEMALSGQAERIWMGEWKGGFEGVAEARAKTQADAERMEEQDGSDEGEENGDGDGELDSEEESAPPEFDLRTGRYISNARPMRTSSNGVSSKQTKGEDGRAVNALIKRANGDVARIAGEASPGAEFLRSQRTWQGLGSDFEIGYQEDGATVEEGRKGIARGYTVGEEQQRT
ncbi:MAG: Diphthamide biosynthesis protein 2 [Bathelium mastoideum]|nr:MAG: Diphthamide biosynthesis protein 2 [Bathelium mastoideum]